MCSLILKVSVRARPVGLVLLRPSAYKMICVIENQAENRIAVNHDTENPYPAAVTLPKKSERWENSQTQSRHTRESGYPDGVVVSARLGFPLSRE